MTAYELAAKEYAASGVDTEAAIGRLKEIPVSVHCWQGDDVIGLDGGGSLSGGIQTTGNYPGRARDFAELTADIKKAFSLMPGKKRLNLHASYAVLNGENVDRDAYRPEHFAPWVQFAKEIGLAGIDFNPTYFSHKNVKDVKDVPADRLTPRLRLKDSLDKILACGYDRSKVVVAVESKVFGIGVESYTVGSNEFYQNYAAKNDICCLLDNGHYHPLEYVSDKIPALLAFYDKVALHVTRGVRWDSDHVVLFDDETKEIAREIVRCGGLEGRVKIALDYFDASINRIFAWVTGFRNVQKALLFALLQPTEQMQALQDAGRFTELMLCAEQLKTMPFPAVWERYCAEQGVPAEDAAWFGTVQAYERDVLSGRV